MMKMMTPLKLFSVDGRHMEKARSTAMAIVVFCTCLGSVIRVDGRAANVVDRTAPSRCRRRLDGDWATTMNMDTTHPEHGPRTLLRPPPPSPILSQACGAVVNRHVSRHKREAPSLVTPEVADDPFNRTGNAVYFSGSPEVLKLRPPSGNVSRRAFPREAFSVSLWVQPEGGQRDPVPILGLYGNCTSDVMVWSLGLRSTSGSDDGRVSYSDDRRVLVFYLSLQSARSRRPTIVLSHQRVLPARWSHLAVVYNGHRLHLYVNGGRVGTGSGQRGPLFSMATADCRMVVLGGNAAGETYFRGRVADMAIWDVALKHREVLQAMKTMNPQIRLHNSYHMEDFHTLENFIILRDRPRLVVSDVNYKRHDVGLSVPSCGMTLCDDPEVVRSYVANPQLRALKTVKYRIISLAEDDGSNPSITPEMIKRQDRAMREAYLPYNITFRLKQQKISNSSLRRRMILEDCLPEMVGNNFCDCTCKHPVTGNDGGDCEDITDDINNFCSQDRRGDGRCDELCNIRHYNWDDGDCCDNSIVLSTCRDPRSPNRIYLGLDEFKKLIDLPTDSSLNIFSVNWTDSQLFGTATFPWDKNVYSVLGGAVMHADVFGVEGRTNNLTHELGHVFGLLHVHHGVYGLQCGDPCMETEPSLTLGDLCEDTRPTSENPYCRDPTPDESQGNCGLGPFTDTPFSNFMAYSSDDCVNHFTPQQAARMHCYIDLTYQSWQVTPKPSPVPLPPRVADLTSESFSLTWLPPIGTGRAATHLICTQCRDDGSLVQYAVDAWSDGNPLGYRDWSALQATGPPDAQPCSSSALAWRPDLRTRCNGPCPELALDLSFKYPVIPRRLSIWVIMNAFKGIRDVELVFKDGARHSLGPIQTECDSPYTTSLSMEKLLVKVRIHAYSHLVAIDAVMLESEPSHTGCDVCPTVQYVIERQPEFPSGPATSNIPYFVDRDVLPATTYIYQVRSILGSEESELSPSLVYRHGDPFCGDGRLDGRSEDCDDGNLMNGDGCNILCEREESFRCHGEPSVCVHHEGDGVCEESERRSSLRDCGFFTPDGALDQWAIFARAKAANQTAFCPETVVVGPAALEIANECHVSPIPNDLIWSPCGHQELPTYFWIEVFFARPVVAAAVVVYAHLVHPSGQMGHNTTMRADLIDVTNVTYHTGDDVEVTCLTHPLMFDVHHNLNRPLVFTKGVRLTFWTFHIGISGVILRTFTTLSHLAAVTRCNTDELYNPTTGRCTTYTCERPLCLSVVIKHASVSCSGNAEGDKCQVTCQRGYEPRHGFRQLVCSGGIWLGNVSCEPISCGQPEISYANTYCPDGHTYGKKCKFECMRSALKIGSGTIIVCEEDGMWSLPEAHCRMTCERPPVLKNATLNTARCPTTPGGFLVGSRCRYRCKEGYHVVGRGFNRRVFWYECSANGLWQGVGCERVYCPAIDPDHHGMYSCTQGNFAGSTCTIKCPGPTRVTSTRTCQNNGHWDADFARCKFEPGFCPAPVSSDGLDFFCENLSIGSRCRVFCTDPRYRPVYDHLDQQLPVSTDLYLTCTGEKLWYPAEQQITCVQRALF